MITIKDFVNGILNLTKNNMNDSWNGFLFDKGMINIFKEVYSNDDFKKSNIIVSYITLAFSPYSDLVHLHKDRIENKKTILSQIDVDNYLDEITSHILIYNTDVFNDDTFINDNEDDGTIINEESYPDEDSPSKKQNHFITQFTFCVNKFINWHRDSKYKNWINSKEFVSINSSYATSPVSKMQDAISKKTGNVVSIQTPDNVVAFTAIKKADLMAKCMLLDEKNSKMEDFLKRKYADLDDIIEKESSIGLAFEDFNIMRHEDRLRMRINNK